MAELKGIKLCGVCANYNWKKHKCKISCNDESDPRARFYGDCPLPDVVPMAEYERLKRICDSYALQYGTAVDKQKIIDAAKTEAAREIFAEIDKCLDGTNILFSSDLAELKKKYTEGDG